MNHNFLIISEKDQKAYLPYKESDLEYYLNQNPNLSKSDVINTYFRKDLSLYKYPSLSRFKETVKLVRTKSNKSNLFAIDLALELMFNYNINPIIISACRSLDELDIYLDCLKENELESFPCFDIIFKYSPTVYKRQFCQYYY